MDTPHTVRDDKASEVAHRERATALLDELAHQARVALRNARIPLNVYFIVPESGGAILTLGAVADKDEWHGLQAEVGKIVRRSIGLNPARCREIICAMSHSDDATS
jgi:hypothetical protein